MRGSRLDRHARMSRTVAGGGRTQTGSRADCESAVAGSSPVAHPNLSAGEVMVIGAASKAVSSLFDSGRRCHRSLTMRVSPRRLWHLASNQEQGEFDSRCPLHRPVLGIEDSALRTRTGTFESFTGHHLACVAEGLGSGLPGRLHGFESRRTLQDARGADGPRNRACGVGDVVAGASRHSGNSAPAVGSIG